MTTTEYVVSGMTCGHCVQAVTTEVGAVPGVSDVKVELSTGALTVTSDPEPSFEQIRAAVDEAGYTVAPG